MEIIISIDNNSKTFNSSDVNSAAAFKSAVIDALATGESEAEGEIFVELKRKDKTKFEKSEPSSGNRVTYDAFVETENSLIQQGGTDYFYHTRNVWSRSFLEKGQNGFKFVFSTAEKGGMSNLRLLIPYGTFGVNREIKWEDMATDELTYGELLIISALNSYDPKTRHAANGVMVMAHSRINKTGDSLNGLWDNGGAIFRTTTFNLQPLMKQKLI